MSNEQNLICNGNIIGFSMSGKYDGEQYKYLPSNSSCWFNMNGGQIQVKNKLYPPMGMSLQLVTTVSYIVCQKIKLEQNITYSLGLTLGNCKDMSNSTIIVTFNNIFITNITANGQLTIRTQIKNFVWLKNTTIANLCFSPVFSGNKPFLGPTINNISLIEVQNGTNSSGNNTNTQNQISNITTDQITNFSTIQNNSFINQSSYFIQIEIYCKTEKKNLYDRILITCNYTNEKFYAVVLQLWREIQLFVQGEFQNQFSVDNILPNSMELILFPKRSYKLTNISISFSQNVNAYYLNQFVSFKFFVDNQIIIFTFLSKQQVTLIKNIYPLAEYILQLTFKVYLVLKSCFFSYFLTDIMSFWNLSLMYNLLNLSTVPLFLRYFFQNLSYQFFQLNSIIEWMGTKIPNLQQKLDFSNTLGSEQMALFKNDYAWFGSFGMSSGFLANNIQNMIMIGILIIKLTLIKYVRKIIHNKCLFPCQSLRKNLQKNIPHGIKIKIILIEELFLISIFMVVSAGTSSLNQGFLLWKQKINSYLQYMVLWITIMLYPLFMIMNVEMRNKKMIKVLRSRFKHQQQGKKSVFCQQQITKKQKIRGKKIFLESVHKICEYLLYTSIPALILINNSTAFLLAMTVIIWLKCWWYGKNRQKFSSNKSLRQKIFIILNLLIWFTHHHVYLIYYTLQKVFQMGENNINHESQTIILNIIKYCAFVSIFTVLIGGLCEILSFLFTTLAYLASIIKYLIKIYKKTKIDKRQVQIQDEQLQKQKRKHKVGHIAQIYPQQLKNQQDQKRVRIKVRITDIRKQEQKMIRMKNIKNQTKVQRYLQEKYGENKHNKTIVRDKKNLLIRVKYNDKKQ